MRIHLFAENSLMLWSTSGFLPQELPHIAYCGYRRFPKRGYVAQIQQLLHIMSRPFSLRISAACARKFNEGLSAEEAPLCNAIEKIRPGDAVLWINPSLAVAPLVDSVLEQDVQVLLYFLDPVHRLGIDSSILSRWSRSARLASYSPEEAREYGMAFLTPYSPRWDFRVERRDLDLVYIGSPSPKRLVWVLLLKLHLLLRGRRGVLLLASRREWLVTLFPGTFAKRVPFDEYLALCSRSRGVLELHERDAYGVTLRATMCQKIGAAHLSNIPTTRQTMLVSIWGWRAIDHFLRSRATSPNPPRLGAPELPQWLERIFAENIVTPAENSKSA